MVGVIVQDVAEGDATTSRETLPTAAEQIEPVLPPSGLQEIVGDKGYHSSQSLVDLEAVGARARAAALHLGRVVITEILTAQRRWLRSRSRSPSSCASCRSGRSPSR